MLFNDNNALYLLAFTFLLFVLDEMIFFGQRIQQFRSSSLYPSLKFDITSHSIILYLSTLSLAFLTACLYIFKILYYSYYDWVLISSLSEIIFSYLLFKIPVLFLTSEEPVLVIILSQSGTSLYLKKFTADFSYSDQLLGAYLSAVDILGSNIITDSGSVDSIKFKDKYNLVLRRSSLNETSVSICYIYKGISYYASQRLDKFVTVVSKEDQLQSIIKTRMFHNRTLQNVDELDTLVTKCFSLAYLLH